ncbi:MAG: TIGR03546 family protein [Deltaproteobacteria bacterium]|nr:TIGR03546 family protein [Deltaproteobacteria bacterium]
MFVIIKTIHSILKVLNSETHPSQLAAGVAFGLLVGLTPFLSLHNLIFFLIVCLFRINLSIFFLSTAFFSLIGWALDPLWDKIGYALLVNFKAARPVWIELSTGAIWPFFRFNNTIVIGSLAAGLVLFIPIWIETVILVKLYRRTLREQIRESKFLQILKATPFYTWYDKYQTLRQKFGLN